MIVIEFDSRQSIRERHLAASDYIGKSVTIFTQHGSIGGVLTLTSTGAIVDGKTFRLDNVQKIHVRSKADWTSNTDHGATSKTVRIHVRCTPEEKRLATRGAIAAGASSLGEWIRDLINDAVS